MEVTITIPQDERHCWKVAELIVEWLNWYPNSAVRILNDKDEVIETRVGKYCLPHEIPNEIQYVVDMMLFNLDKGATKVQHQYNLTK